MPRKARIDASGALHHIITRGIERRPIFKDASDYADFTRRLGLILKETSTSCYAWCLMPNHVHLLLRTGLHPISTVMRRLLTGHARYFNRRHDRNGHLFQNRFKSILCEEEPYLLVLVRYIHLNPVRAGIVKSLERLAFDGTTGHGTLMGRLKYDWQDTGYILSRFGKKGEAARKAYAEFVKKGIHRGNLPELTGGGLLRSFGGWLEVKEAIARGERIVGDERILGSGEFVDRVLKQAQEDFDWKTKAKWKGLDLETLIDSTTNQLGVKKELIYGHSKNRLVARARAVVSFLAVRRLNYRGTDVARVLQVAPATVAKCLERGSTDPLTQELAGQLLDA